VESGQASQPLPGWSAMSPILTPLMRRTTAAVRAAAGTAAHGRSLLLDRLHGIRTADVISLEELGLDEPDRVGHVPSPWGTLRRVLDASRIDPDDVFVDIGSGLGRIVYLAARYPFGRVEGLEISERLVALSRTNLGRARPPLRCRDVRIVNADLLDYELPDDATFVYCFNPFKRGIFEALLAKIFASIDRRPRAVTFIYLNPVEHDLVLASRRAELTRAHSGSRLLPGPREPHTANVYRLR
jgi:SAM-dependent methyltransferase